MTFFKLEAGFMKQILLILQSQTRSGSFRLIVFFTFILPINIIFPLSVVYGVVGGTACIMYSCMYNYVCVYKCMHECMYISVYVCIYACMYACMYPCTHKWYVSILCIMYGCMCHCFKI